MFNIDEFIMIQSVKKVFEILEYISQNGNLVRLSDIASALQIQKTTAHNFLNSLKELGYLEQDELSPRYRLTSKLQDLYLPVSTLPILKNKLRPALEQITMLTGETSYLSVQMGTFFRHELICEPKRSVRISLELNKDFGMLKTAIGKVFMANSTHLQKALLENVSEIEKKKIIKELQQISQLDYALDFEEFEPDLNCVAIPIKEQQRVIAVLGVSGPAFRFQEEEMLKAVTILQDSCINYLR